mgnify:CR=1 FL=1
MATKEKDDAPEPVAPSATPNLVTHVAVPVLTSDTESLSVIATAMEREMYGGHQFCTMQAGHSWLVFYSGPIKVH